MKKRISLRTIILITADVICLYFCCMFSYFLKIDTNILQGAWTTFNLSTLAFIVFSIIGLRIFNVYKIIWRFSSAKDYIACFCGLILGTIAYKLVGFIVFQKFYFTIYNIGGLMFCITGVVGIRIIYRYIISFDKKSSGNTIKKNTMIIGGGHACKILLDEIQFKDSEYFPLCIVDDDQSKQGKKINGVTIFSPTMIIGDLCKKFDIHSIIFAIPSCSEEDRARILNFCAETNCEIKTIPYVHDLIFDGNILGQAKPVKIEELLGRNAVKLDDKSVQEYILNKVCFVTGGGGSIGSELCRQIMSFAPKKLIIIDNYENNAYNIEQELFMTFGNDANVVVEICSVQDKKKLDILFSQYRPQLVFHAAAHKHVPLMETNPEEAVKNNVFGTLNVARLANDYYVEKFVLISTDKAVNPTSIMGATKRCCEMIVQSMTENSKKTEFVAVRFGNVLGSNGSVIPLFKKQIESGGPVRVTHPDIIRYFMTIPEATSLVLKAGTIAKGGEIFVLDMGKPVKIVTLAQTLIKLYGLDPNKNMPIIFTGLRPGEKLYEELLMSEEGLKTTEENKIFVVDTLKINEEEFNMRLEELKTYADNNDKNMIITTLKTLIPSFEHIQIYDEKEDLEVDNQKLS